MGLAPRSDPRLLRDSSISTIRPSSWHHVCRNLAVLLGNVAGGKTIRAKAADQQKGITYRKAPIARHQLRQLPCDNAILRSPPS
jgi:hypothetical protein